MILKKIIAGATVLGMVISALPVLAQESGVPAACVGITFTRNLSLGSRGADVKCLQALLNKDPATKVAESGPGSLGNETTYFGPLTKAAVVKFQEKYAADILTPLGLTTGTGLVGPKTRAKLNELLTGVTPTPTPTPTPTATPTPTPAVEGALTVSVEPTPVNVTVNPGEQNKAVAAFKFNAIVSPIKVERVDLSFDTVKPYRCFNYLSLYEGDNAIKGVSITKDVVLETFPGVYTLRLSGLDWTIPANSSKVLTVKLSAVSTYPSDCQNKTITLSIPLQGVRGVDSAGYQQYAGNVSRTFKTSGAAVSGTLKASLSTQTPAEGLAIISGTAETSEVELAKFDVKWENLGGKVTALEATIKTDTDHNLGKVNSLRLYDGTTLLGEVEVATSAASKPVSFTGLEVSMAKDVTKTFTVKAVVGKDFTEGKYLNVTLTKVYGEDENETSVDTGSLDLAAKSLYIYKIAPEVSLASAGVNKVAKNSYEVTLTLKVVARGDNVYLKKGTDSDDWLSVNPPSGANPSLCYADVTASGAEEVTKGEVTYFKVLKDQTANITLKVRIDVQGTGGSGYYTVAVGKITWRGEGGSDTDWSKTTHWALKNLKLENISVVYET